MNYQLHILATLGLFCANQLTAHGVAPSADTIQTRRFASTTQLGEASVTANRANRVKRSAFQTQSIDTHNLQNTTRSLADALNRTAGLRLRASGGVGAESQLSLDGLSGKHVKIFIDGVPQEGVAQSFSLQNIPAGFADRIEVYKGVVPVQFGTDAMGGVVNIITKQQAKPWHAEAAYSYGSFGTHRWQANWGKRLKGGWTFDIQAFQNYSDNDYWIDAHVEDFQTGSIDKKNTQRVKRFNDRYHNEVAVGKMGVTHKPWADRLLLTLTYSQMQQQVQNGVRQDIVYGDKHRHAHAWVPQIEYAKRNLLQGLDVQATINYSHNTTTQVDTSSYHYNWLGESILRNSPGEQSYQHLRATNQVWNYLMALTYRLGLNHTFTLSHTTQTFHRTNESLLGVESEKDAIARHTNKHHSGLQYRFLPNEKWNATAFIKHYAQSVIGPMALDANASSYTRISKHLSTWGYGLAATWFAMSHLQTKLSYEKAYRLPSIDEMFGDNDLEMGDVSIRPESSHNYNLSLNYHNRWRKHQLTAEVGGVIRDTRDYIQRNIINLSGGKQAATYINYGKVLTRGYNLHLRYAWGPWMSTGGNITHMRVIDNQSKAAGSNAANLLYHKQMPNLPYFFTDADITLTWPDAFRKGNKLSLTYDNQYVHSFCYYSQSIGNNQNEYLVPTQWSHNLTLSYSIGNRYHLSAECNNFTNARLYDNFSLQKPGRAFYGKLRITL